LLPNMLKKQYDLIIFDCDGTLVDSENLNSKAVSEVLISLGLIKYTHDYCMANFTGISLSNLLAHLDGESPATLPKTEIIQQFVERGTALAHQHLQATPNAYSVVAKVAHKKCVASNGQRTSVLESLKITGLNNFFPEPHVFTASQVKHGKPAPDLFLFAAKQMGVKPDNCLVIEDSLTGIKAAKAAGMNVLGFIGGSHHNPTTHRELQKLEPHAIISNLNEILDYL
jgi:HAD superfamily hydrolase (TIGR01509 family)